MIAPKPVAVPLFDIVQPEGILNVLPPLTTPSQFAEIQAKFVKLKEDCKKVNDS